MQTDTSPQAILLVSFGGPEKPDDVIPFLENVLRGRNVPRERMMAVAEHYYHFGGKSPINDQNRALIAALEGLLETEGPRLPIYFGNRNWHPMLADTLAKMRDDGITHALAFVTSAFSSYSGCRQYRENIAAAQAAVGEGAPRIDKLRGFHNHPKFIEVMIARTQEALAAVALERRDAVTILFSAHSIPESMAAGCAYAEQLRDASGLVAEAVGAVPALGENSPSGETAASGATATSNGASPAALPLQWRVVYQSRSGPASQPWLGPDVGDAIDEEADRGRKAVVVVPIGFISDHMEVIHDLDHDARERAEARDLQMVRAATAGTHPVFVSMIRDLIVERTSGSPERPCIGALGPRPDVCLPDCCLAPPRPVTPPAHAAGGRPQA